ncbi:MAG: T9SS type A sorting domain-containing protein [Chitinophagales bacterium]|nr:T9SS type A sorting domain-containing protein [Chitinophagales bacterium]
MKKIFLSFAFLMTIIALPAQKYDYVWLAGDDNSINNNMHGGILFNFNRTPVTVHYRYREHNFFKSNASISDSSGNLLMYSNGCIIADSSDSVISNGEDINLGSNAFDIFCNQNSEGYGGGYPSMFFLPKPGIDSVWYLFHKSILYVGEPSTDAFQNKLLFSIVYKNLNTNKLYVKQKNIELYNSPLSTGEFIAVKHADGASWWLVTPLRNSNTFLFFRFDSSGVAFSHEQTIGNLPPLSKEGYGQMTFNHQGNMLARYYPTYDVELFDFDRTTGLLNNHRTFSLNYDAFTFDGGCCFSPSGQYLYIMATINMYQVDITASDISSTQITVESWDGFVDPIAPTFGFCQLGPDCKIYINGPDLRYYHVIHKPDLPGLACEAEQRGLLLPTPNGASIPYFPNYRLGPPDNPGPPCTATVSVQGIAGASGAGLKVFPNPASQMVYLDYRIEGGEARFELWNTLGQVMKSVSLNAADNFGGVSTAELPGGIYVYRLMIADKLVQSGTLSIQR